MSKCPDAYVCETLYAQVIEQVGDIVDLNVDYIAKVDTTQETGFNCMHGQSECLGDLQQVCAKHYYAKNYTWWNFLLCEDQTQENIPDNGPQCASLNGMNSSQINNCVNSPEGKSLLLNSITYTQQRNVDVSCTIWIQNQLFCVHDEYWKNCRTHDVNGIVQYICQSYKGPHLPPACNAQLY